MRSFALAAALATAYLLHEPEKEEAPAPSEPEGGLYDPSPEEVRDLQERMLKFVDGAPPLNEQGR